MTTVAETKVKRTKSIDPKADNKIIVIDDSGIFLMEKSSTGKVKPIGILELEHLSEVFSVKQPFKSNFITQSCFSIDSFSSPKTHKEYFILAYQFNPFTLEIKFQTSGDYRYFTIGLPYVQFFVALQRYQEKYARVGNTYITCTTTPVRSLEDPLFRIPLNNVDPSSGNICFGKQEMPQNHKLSPSAYGQEICQGFLNSPFNSDLTPYPVPGFETYTEWAANFVKNPKMALEGKFLTIGYTPRHLIESITNSLRRLENGF